MLSGRRTRGTRKGWKSPPGFLLTPAVCVLLQNEAKEDFDQAIGWCVSLITDYRVRLGTWGCAALDTGTGLGQSVGLWPATGLSPAREVGRHAGEG